MPVLGTSALTSKQVIGWFFETRNAAAKAAWVEAVANLFMSNEETETYAGLGANPVMKETLGQLNVHKLSTKKYQLTNREYDASIEIPVADMRRDKTGQIRARVNQLAQSGIIHWKSLLSTLLLNGEAAACYDEQYFFSASHAEGTSGTQVNLLTNSHVSALNVSDSSAPTAAEMVSAILGVINYMQLYKDDKGELCQEDASEFLVMCPPNKIFESALAAVTSDVIASSTNVITKSEMKITVVNNPRLSAWTASFGVFRTDTDVKALLRQEEVKEELKVIAEGSERETEEKTHLYSCQATRAAGYGDWRKCAKATLS